MLFDASTGASELFQIKWEQVLFGGHNSYPSDCNWVNVSSCKKMKNPDSARRPMVAELKWDSLLSVTQLDMFIAT